MLLVIVELNGIIQIPSDKKEEQKNSSFFLFLKVFIYKIILLNMNEISNRTAGSAIKKSFDQGRDIQSKNIIINAINNIKNVSIIFNAFLPILSSLFMRL